MAKKEGKKGKEKKAGKKQVEKKPAAKKEKADIWAPEETEKKKAAEEKVEKGLAPKASGKKEEKPGEQKQIHLASAKELEQSGIDTSIIFYPLVTEKAVNMIEAQNKLCFVVSNNATKTTVKKAIGAMFGAKVDAVNIVWDMKGRKKAIVKINKRFKADEIAMKLGVI